MKKKRLDWCCNICDSPRRLFASHKEVIAHYRKNHPASGWSLWDIGADVGDAIGNSALHEMRQRWRTDADLLKEAKIKVEAYDQLLERWNALCRALHIGASAMDAFRDAYEKKEPTRG